LAADAGDLPRQCLHWKKTTWAQDVMNGGTSLTSFLVFHVEGDRISKKQLFKGGSEREYDSVVPKCDVLEAELHCPCANIGLRHGILAHKK
jgi:hypothetical protein